jgi:hypothetical protein
MHLAYQQTAGPNVNGKPLRDNQIIHPVATEVRCLAEAVFSAKPLIWHFS